ncbi:Outer membrane protein G precursor [Escherichia coli]|nr:Outer membrane protein G precursor [Escherichia coli]
MKLQGVIFDLDGVITDTAHLHFQAWQQIAAEIGISIDAQFNESLKGISRDESLRRILQHGGKEGDFNSQERAQLAYRKNLLYVHSLRELTVNAVLPGIRSLLAALRAQQIPVGLASVSLNAPTILAALELREFFTFYADASQLKNSKPDPEIFLAACAGLGVPPQACIGIEDAQAGIDAINASGMRSVGIGAGLTGAQLLLPSTESLTENVEGYGEDMDGLAEPSVYFNAANGPWRIALAYYQEGPVDYSAGKRGTWFDRPELEVHYQFLENDDFSFGLTGGFRNYGYHYVDEPGKDTANMQRWKIAPDWDVKLTDDLRFNGWLSMYKFANDLNTTGYADTRVETETGLQYTFNETVALRVNYYLERGFNMDDSRNNGEFSTQEIRAYLPLTLGNHSVTPYTRIGLDRWSNWDWQDDIEREGHDFNRVGLFYGYDFQNGLSVSLEYAFEWQDHDEGDSDKFHYAGVGVNYSF